MRSLVSKGSLLRVGFSLLLVSVAAGSQLGRAGDAPDKALPPLPNIWRNSPATPERMEQRLREAASVAADHGPVPRIMLFDIGYPQTPKEYTDLGGMAVLLMTAETHDKAELPLKNVRIVVHGRSYQLEQFKSTFSAMENSDDPVVRAFGPYREDSLYLLPIKLRAKTSALVFDFSAGQSDARFEFRPLPHKIRKLVGSKVEAHPTEQAVEDFVRQQFPGFFDSRAPAAVPTGDASAPGATSGPRWRSHLVLWAKEDGGPGPWRSDPRFQGHFEPGYPDDTPVLFLNPATGPSTKNEVMWVTVIDYDPGTDQFLGILINQPDYLHDLAEGDTVVFGFPRKFDGPVAVNLGEGFRAPALPDTRAPEFLRTLMAGVRDYRQGHFGNNEPGIERCIETLSPAVQVIPASASAEEQFAAHFVLARCLAEKYETQRAIEEFKSAIAIDPSDRDAQVGLLAELSLKVHPSADEPMPVDQPTWDAAFLEQLALVKAHFPSDQRVQKMLTLIFHEPTPEELTKMNEAELARWRKFGSGFIRWKMR